MELILIAILFILQLISFYFIVLLNVKVSKYKDLEQKQQKLIEEMDNSIGAYLFEMKEENNRLIEELKVTSIQQTPSGQQLASSEGLYETQVLADKKRVVVPKTIAASVYERNIESQSAAIAPDKANAILKGMEPQHSQSEPLIAPVAPLTFEQKVKKMYDEGQTIEQIAKKTNKGKTEIELLLKFSS